MPSHSLCPLACLSLYLKKVVCVPLRRCGQVLRQDIQEHVRLEFQIVHQGPEFLPVSLRDSWDIPGDQVCHLGTKMHMEG